MRSPAQVQTVLSESTRTATRILSTKAVSSRSLQGGLAKGRPRDRRAVPPHTNWGASPQGFLAKNSDVREHVRQTAAQFCRTGEPVVLFCENGNEMRIKIASIGEPVLRGEARPLAAQEIGTQHIRDLIEHMRETLSDAPGVGLAAPQIGEPLQLAIIEDKAEYHANLSAVDLAERERGPLPFHVLINPQIHLLSPPEVTFFEGCLSLPGFTGIVPRARRVLVEALDHLGHPVRIEATGWYARILQHEIDHLGGTLYIDRVWSRSLSSLENYNRHWKSKTMAELRAAFINKS
jgi:peptide deformylase